MLSKASGQKKKAFNRLYAGCHAAGGRLSCRVGRGRGCQALASAG
jgi:hypothetical protein